MLPVNSTAGNKQYNWEIKLYLQEQQQIAKYRQQ